MKWPQLSEQLTGPKRPGVCQSCGGAGDDRWRECDDRDGFTAIVVILCTPCASRLIEPHPRLYAQLQRHEPFPGTHDLCLPCLHRDGTICRMSRAHGGEGLVLAAHAMRGIVCSRGRGGGKTYRLWTSGPDGCDKLTVE